MSHLVSALLLFTLTSPTNPLSSSLPDAPELQLQQPQEPAAPISTGASSPLPPSRPTPDPHWLQVEQLPPGQLIAVLERGSRSPTSCNMGLASDSTLACTQPIPYSQPRRLVFPIGNIAAVFTEEMKFGPSLTAILGGAGIGAALGVGVCNEAPARTILACSLLGGAIGAGAATTPARSPRPPHIRRRLIYRAP